MFLLKKISKDQYITLYALIAAITYTWSVLQFFWNVPSWLFFSSIGELAAMFAYTMTVNLVESLLVFFFVAAFFNLLPAAWTAGQLIPKAALFIFAALGFLIYRSSAFPAKTLAEVPKMEWALLLAVMALIVAAPFKKYPPLCRALESLADRFLVYLYVLIPISILSLMTVILRNIF